MLLTWAAAGAAVTAAMIVLGLWALRSMRAGLQDGDAGPDGTSEEFAAMAAAAVAGR